MATCAHTQCHSSYCNLNMTLIGMHVVYVTDQHAWHACTLQVSSARLATLWSSHSQKKLPVKTLVAGQWQMNYHIRIIISILHAFKYCITGNYQGRKLSQTGKKWPYFAEKLSRNVKTCHRCVRHAQILWENFRGWLQSRDIYKYFLPRKFSAMQ